MTNLLRKLFIKDFNNISNPKIRQKHGLLASFVGAISNLLLCVFKIVIGLIVQSMTIITDAVNNLTDMGSCLVNILGFKISAKPADKEHPFGHERIEYIAGLIICFIIIGLALILGYTSVLKIINKDYTTYDLTTFIVAVIILVAAIIVKLWQGIFYKKIAKLINSVSLKASGQDSINDVISTSVVLIATILEFVLQQYDVHLDAYFSIAVALFIIIMGVKLAIETCNPLIGITPNHELVKSAVKNIKEYEGVLGVHDIMCHSYGPTKVFMTLHVEVDSNISALVSHDLIDNIENEVGNKYGMIITIHMDPIETKSEEINYLKEKTQELLRNLDNSFTFHDLRIVKGDSHTNVLFDVLASFESKITDEQIISYLKEEYKKIDPKYNLVIKIDHDYVED
ncbi:MAG: cation diffusion facilitator family transporter [Bacilli bacterium]|nr:cation diffusion facilitator family transporter [Bacilli bacterium]